jgi:hypothetical protein
MNLRRLITATTLILLVAVSLAQPAAGSDFTVLLNGSQFRITWKINAMQNLTALAKTISFPQNLSSTLTGTDLAAFSSALQNALQAKVATVQISQPEISLSSNGVNATCSNHCPFQWLNATIAFNVHENPVQANGLGEYDMSWKAIRLEDNLKVNGIAFNTLGETYLLQGLASFFPTPTTLRTITVKIGGLLVNKNTYQDPTGKIVLLDTSAFQTPISNWVHTQNIQSRTQNWTSPQNAGFNITANQQITEVGFQANLYYFAAARVSGEISTSLNTFAQKDTLFVDFSNGLWKTVGAAAILSVLGILIVTVILERRITGQLRQRRKGGKSR